MHRRTLLVPLALLAALSVSACSPSGGTGGTSPSPDATTAATEAAETTAPAVGTEEPAASVSASPSADPTLRTQPGGGTLQFAGGYTEMVSFDSTYCLFFHGTLFNFQAPATGVATDSSGGWVMSGDPGKLAFGKGDDITGGTIHQGVTVDGTSLDFDQIEVTVTKANEGIMSATLSGRLTCSDIEG